MSGSFHLAAPPASCASPILAPRLMTHFSNSLRYVTAFGALPGTCLAPRCWYHRYHPAPPPPYDTHSSVSRAAGCMPPRSSICKCLLTSSWLPRVTLHAGAVRQPALRGHSSNHLETGKLDQLRPVQSSAVLEIVKQFLLERVHHQGVVFWARRKPCGRRVTPSKIPSWCPAAGSVYEAAGCARCMRLHLASGPARGKQHPPRSVRQHTVA